MGQLVFPYHLHQMLFYTLLCYYLLKSVCHIFFLLLIDSLGYLCYAFHSTYRIEV